MSTPNPETAPETPPVVRRTSRGGFAGRYTGTIILVAVFAVLAGALLLLTNNPGAGVLNPTPTVTPPPKVWDLSAGTTQGLSVAAVTGTVALQIVNNQWQITAPSNQPANQLTVGSAAEQLKTLQATQAITGTSDLSQYGLTTPSITITLVISGVTPPTNRLLVGGTTIDGGSYYVKANDNPQVFVVQNTLIEQLKSWLTTPPVAEPTPTPLVVATLEPTATVTPTGSPVASGPASAPTATPAAATGGGTAATPTTAPVAAPSPSATP